MILGNASTTTDVAASEWAIDDLVVRLREWGTETSLVLPAPPVIDCTIGADDSCVFRLRDPSGRVSRVHARLVWRDGGWLLCDLGSKNGVRIDGARRSQILLEPGLEIGIGGLTLIAESSRSIALRNFLFRLLGWRSDRLDVVDHAMRSIRLAATHRVALVLCGDGDLVPTARSLHRRTLGDVRPFIVCDPRRRRMPATVRSAENYESGMAALRAAHGGSLCVRGRRLPRDFPQVIEALREPGARVQLVVCAGSSDDCKSYLAVPITIPPLASREAELDRIITEYADDALAELAAPRTAFLTVDRAWIHEHAATSLPSIEKAALRLVALRDSRNLSAAAARLGMAPVSLSRWIGRREMPMKVVP